MNRTLGSVVTLVMACLGLSVAAKAAPSQGEPGLDCSRPDRPLLHPAFGDHMVLQHGSKVRLSGCNTPGQPVTTRFSGQTAQTKADQEGRWAVEMGPFAPNQRPQALEVEGDTQRILTDVLVGEVWLCSGQSNMQYGLQYALNGEAEVQDSVNYPTLRLFEVGKDNAPEPQAVFQTASSWVVSGQPLDGTRWFSAVCYFMGRTLSRQLQMPIGLIDASFSGSIIESWLSAEVLQTLPRTQFASASAPPGQAPKVTSSGPSGFPFYDSSLFNAMISPLLTLSIRGALWYQGEGNAWQPQLYYKMLPALIDDWRSRFGLGAFPFVIVQLPNVGLAQTQPIELSYWPEMRDVQRQVADEHPNTGLVVSIDVGSTELHPPDKQDIGSRAAAWAMTHVYGSREVGSGPVYRGLERQAGKLRLAFDGLGTGLMIGQKQGAGPVTEFHGGTLKAFAIAGESGVYAEAEAVIDGDSVVLSSPLVPHPLFARYGWAGNPSCRLYNREGFPAAPFRSE